MGGPVYCRQSACILTLSLLTGCMFAPTPSSEKDRPSSHVDMSAMPDDMAALTRLDASIDQEQDSPEPDMEDVMVDDMMPDHSPEMDVLDPCALIRCGGTQQCLDGECVACIDDSHCDTLRTCVDHQCQPISCSASEACPDGRCHEDVCVECVDASECPGNDGFCLEGLCVNLWSDKDNCGGIRTACPAGAQCVEGACLCDSFEHDEIRRVAIFNHYDKLISEPTAQLFSYPSQTLYTCSLPVDDMNSCTEQGGTLSFNEQISLLKPHFLATGVGRVYGDNDQDQLLLKGVGAAFGVLESLTKAIPDSLNTPRAADEEKIALYRVVPVTLDTYIIFILWESFESSEQQSLRAYVVHPDEPHTPYEPLDVERLPLMTSVGESVHLSEMIRDFDVEVNELGIVLALSQVSEDGSELRLMTLNHTDEALITTSNQVVPLPHLVQQSEGMGMMVHRFNDVPRLHVSVFESASGHEDEQVEVGPDVGYERMYANMYAFDWSASESRFVIPEQPQPQPISHTDVSTSQYVVPAMLPSPFELFWDDGVASFGWSRTTGPDEESTSFLMHRFDGETTVVSTLPLNNTIVDGVFTHDKDGSALLFELAVPGYKRVDPRSTNVKLSRVEQSANGWSAHDTRPVSSLRSYQRMSVVVGPHVTGILATTDKRPHNFARADLFFTLDRQPVCQTSPPLEINRE